MENTAQMKDIAVSTEAGVRPLKLIPSCHLFLSGCEAAGYSRLRFICRKLAARGIEILSPVTDVCLSARWLLGCWAAGVLFGLPFASALLRGKVTPAGRETLVDVASALGLRPDGRAGAEVLRSPLAIGFVYCLPRWWLCLATPKRHQNF